MVMKVVVGLDGSFLRHTPDATLSLVLTIDPADCHNLAK
jgi:hypothetical protein